MPRFLLDLEVETHATLTPGDVALHADSVSGGIEVFVAVVEATPGHEKSTLSLQLVLNAENIQNACDRGLDVAKNFLRAWSFTTSIPFRISRFRRVVDWTPGLRERECIHFSHHPGHDRPYLVLDAEALQSATRLSVATLSPTLRRAIRWYANGVSSEFVDDQFYYFWQAVELVAIETKSPDPVHDACPKCRTPLFCPSCNLQPVHKPYPKQAIQALFRRHVTDYADILFEHAVFFRNTMMHGDDIDVLEVSRQVKFVDIVNGLGRLAWAALLSALSAKLAAAGESRSLPILETEEYVNYELKVGLNLVVTSRDPDHPSLSDLPSFEVTVDSHSGAN